MKIELLPNKLNIFVAYSRKNKVIGYQNDLPWKRSLKADLAYLNILTTEKKTVIIMGRKTFESIGRPLPKRMNIVLTKSKINDTMCCTSLKEAIEFCNKNQYYIAIFGGTEVFKEALNYDHQLFCTIVENDYEGDTFFPLFNHKLREITLEVDKLLKEKNAKMTWELKNGKFVENNIVYGFYTN